MIAAGAIFCKRPTIQPMPAFRTDGRTGRWYGRINMLDDDHGALFESPYSQHQSSRCARIQLAPANLHWCSDDMLGHLSDLSRKYAVLCTCTCWRRRIRRIMHAGAAAASPLNTLIASVCSSRGRRSATVYG